MDGDCIPELFISSYDQKSILVIDSRTGLLKLKTPQHILCYLLPIIF